MQLTCPECGTQLELALVKAGRPGLLGEPHSPPLIPDVQYSFTVAGIHLELASRDILEAKALIKRPIFDSYVEIPDEDGVVGEYPSKDLVRQAILRRYPEIGPESLQPYTGFQSQRAEQILRRLGFTPLRKRRR